MEEKKQFTGMLREDLELIVPGEHGNYYMLFDPVSEHYFRLSDETHRALELLDRSYELEAFEARLHGAGVIWQRQELLEFLQFLHGNNLMIPEYGSTAAKMGRLREWRDRNWLNTVASAYLFFKLPPLRPDRFFDVCSPVVERIFSRPVLMIVTLVSLCGYGLMLREWNAVVGSFRDSLSWSGLVSYFWALLVVKVLHELAHGFAAKHYGCRIRAMGVSFIVFYPRLFTDLTDGWRLARRKRIVLDGAGIALELLLGGVAALVWVYAAPGALRSTMFYLFAVSALGTILVNGNPFIRYDGYYLLSDLLDIDNLMGRSGEYVRNFNRRKIFGIGPQPDAGGGSGTFLYYFGIGAFLYRVFLYSSIILLIYFEFAKPLALFLMAMEIYALVVMPLQQELRVLRQYRSELKKRHFAFVAGGSGLAALVLALPLNWDMKLPCEILPEKRALVVVPESGYAVSSIDGESIDVLAGQEIFKLENCFIDRNLLRSQLQAAGSRAEMELLRLDPATTGEAKTVFERWQNDCLSMKELARRRESLSVNASLGGWFVPYLRSVSPGQYLEKGTVIGAIFSHDRQLIAYASDRQINRLRSGDRVEIVFRGELAKYAGKVSAINPIAVQFTDSALVESHGGPLACYPDRGNGHYRPVQTYYAVTVLCDEALETFLPGRTGAIYVEKRYVLGAELGRSLAHVFWREFSF